MHTIRWLARRVLVVAAVGCGGGGKSARTSDTDPAASGGGGGDGIALRSVATALPLTADSEFVRLIGVAANGETLDYGEVKRAIALDHGRVRLPAGTPANARELALTTGTRTFVLVVDPDRPASEIQKAVGELDKVCWGFGVAVGSKLGVTLPAPCPAGPIAADLAEFINLAMVVSADKVRFEVSHVNEVASVDRSGDVKAKLAEYKQSEFFKGKPCPAERPAQPEEDASEEDDGMGTAMAFSMEDHGRCDVLIAFDDTAKAGDVIDFFLTAMAAGFTEPHWATKSQLPAIDTTPPKPKAPDPDTPEFRAANKAVEKAQKKVDDARAEVLAMTKDTSTSVAQIKKAVAREKRAEEELKAAKKKRKAARDKANKKSK
jgi:hypothetical protein